MLAVTPHIDQMCCVLGSTQLYRACICMLRHGERMQEKNGSWGSYVGGEILCNKPL